MILTAILMQQSLNFIFIVRKIVGKHKSFLLFWPSWGLDVLAILRSARYDVDMNNEIKINTRTLLISCKTFLPVQFQFTFKNAPSKRRVDGPLAKP